MTNPAAEILAALDFIPTCNITGGCRLIATWCWWSTCSHNGGLACGPCAQMAARDTDFIWVCNTCGHSGTPSTIIHWKGL